MKRLNKKQIIFGSIALGCLIFLIYMLACPLGHLSNRYFVYFPDTHEVVSVGSGSGKADVSNPFIVYGKINIPQVVVFCIMSLALIACIILFCKFTPHSPTKAERLQAQIDELQKQVDELKNDK